MMNKNSEIITSMTGLIYPLIILFGLYIILNGHRSPGGGFQGGAVLATVFISRYLVDQNQKIQVKTLQKLEKLFLLALILLVIVFIFTFTNNQSSILNRIYLISMNALIGFKVCCGLMIIFYRFVYWEDLE